MFFAELPLSITALRGHAAKSGTSAFTTGPFNHSAGKMVAQDCQTDVSKQAADGRRAGRPQELAPICRMGVQAPPDSAGAWHLAGLAQWKNGAARQAEIHLSRAVELDPHNLDYCNTLGVFLIESGQFQRAEALLLQALQLDPRSSDLLCNLGRAMLLQQRFAEALARFREALAHNPQHAVLLANMGVTYQALGQLDEAVAWYRRALRLAPQRPKWWTNLGAALVAKSSYASAETCFQQALALAPDYLPAAKGLGITCCALGNYENALPVIQRALHACPDDAEAIACLAVIYQHTGCWEAFKRILPQLARHTEEALLRNEVPAEQPLFNISRTDDQYLNLAVARAWSQSIARCVCRGARPFVHQAHRRYANRRITIGYLSADFRNHAVAHQAVAMFALHDRSRFRVCAFSVGPPEQDDYRRRIAASCDHFGDLAGADARQAAVTIYDQRVDILIDLMGHTHRNRLDICALRPAPVQIAYLGFLASSGADFIDYLIGDPVVTPPEHAPFYSEKLIRLPHCYQIVSPTPPAASAVNRGDAGLPEEAFVFCCFNQIYKIEPLVFGCWMQILKKVPQAVLWLYRPNATAVAKLQAAALQQGVTPERLIFADKMPLADHLNRLRLADVALDTVLYNGGATTANALVAEVPVVTTLGNHFVSRMSASHLRSLGLDELIAGDLQAYGRLAVELAASPQRLRSVQRHLKSALEISPLLDTARFVRNIEQAYLRAWWRCCEGLPPEHLEIPPGRSSDLPHRTSIAPEIDCCLSSAGAPHERTATIRKANRHE